MMMAGSCAQAPQAPEGGDVSSDEVSDGVATLTAWLKGTRPQSEYTIKPYAWSFDAPQGFKATEQSRYSRTWHVLLSETGEVEPGPKPVGAILASAGFATKAADHPAAEWAQLVICAVGLMGKRLVDEAYVRHVLPKPGSENVHAPAVEQTDQGPQLTFWTYSHYRGRHLFYGHKVAPDGQGGFVHTQ
jgi:hypothetical protein